MVELKQAKHGVLLPVIAQPGARRNTVVGEHGGSLKVAVTAVREKGKANRAVASVLADALELKKSQLSLIAGETSSRKQFLVQDVPLAELLRRVAACLDAAG